MFSGLQTWDAIHLAGGKFLWGIWISPILFIPGRVVHGDIQNFPREVERGAVNFLEFRHTRSAVVGGAFALLGYEPKVKVNLPRLACGDHFCRCRVAQTRMHRYSFAFFIFRESKAFVRKMWCWVL